jgi:hypothetical protein
LSLIESSCYAEGGHEESPGRIHRISKMHDPSGAEPARTRYECVMGALRMTLDDIKISVEPLSFFGMNGPCAKALPAITEPF